MNIYKEVDMSVPSEDLLKIVSDAIGSTKHLPGVLDDILIKELKLNKNDSQDTTERTDDDFIRVNGNMEKLAELT
ncbi:hypothetical protein J4231_01120 [Candidatus Woesearchaeota archaeon]|nr:hypothetical protein [Candidatus Woesearchaeota archaeon]